MALQLLLLLAPLLLRLAGAAHSAGIIRAAADNILESVYSSDTLVGGVAFNNVNYGFGGAAGSFPFTFAAPRHNIAVNAIDVGVPGSVRVSFEVGDSRALMPCACASCSCVDKAMRAALSLLRRPARPAPSTTRMRRLGAASRGPRSKPSMDRAARFGGARTTTSCLTRA
jgi:hypothetical protein